MNPSDITEHMEVVGSDGQHVGTVDHLAIKLTKSDPASGGTHRVLNIDLVQGVRDGKLVLNVSGTEARQEAKALSA